MIHVYGMIHFKIQLCLTVFCPCFGRLNTPTITSLLMRSTGDCGVDELCELVYDKMPVVFKSPLSKMVPPKHLQWVWFGFDLQLSSSTISSFDSFIHSVSGHILQ